MSLAGGTEHLSCIQVTMRNLPKHLLTLPEKRMPGNIRTNIGNMLLCLQLQGMVFSKVKFILCDAYSLYDGIKILKISFIFWSIHARDLLQFRRICLRVSLRDISQMTVIVCLLWHCMLFRVVEQKLCTWIGVWHFLIMVAF